MLKFSAFSRGIVISLILSVITTFIFYITLSSNINRSSASISSVLPSSYDFAKVDGQNTETLNEVLNNLNVASISISENDNTILEESLLASSSIGIQSVLQKVFPQSVNTIDVNGKNVTYSVNLTNNVFYSLILCAVAIFSIFLASITTASSCAKKTVSQMIKLKDAILNKNYDEIPFTDLSKVLASNEEKFTTELNGAKKKIEELQVSNARDPLTGLYNRSEFKNVFEKCFKKGLATTKTHALGFVRASEILTINSDRGYQIGDKYIMDVASIIKESIEKIPEAKAYRINGSDFAILFSNFTEQDIDTFHTLLKGKAEIIQKANELNTLCYAGYTIFKPNETPENVMARADLALAKAQSGAANGYKIENVDVEGYLQGEIYWRQTVVDIINRHAVTLFYQPIKSLNISITPYVEILARFHTKDGEIISTENVLAAAHRHDLIVRLEELIIENIIQKYNKINNRTVRFGINLSANVLISTSFLLWLERTLVRNADIADNLVFEIDEDLLESNPTGAERLFSILRRANAHTSISHFGNGIESFKIYRELKPDYIKLDPNLCQKLEKDIASQQFIRMIIETSHRTGCVVIAEGVETTIQRQQLETLYIDAMQGYIIAKPQELTDTIDLSQVRTFARDLQGTYVA